MKWIITTLFALLRGGRVVYLKDFQGETYISIAKRDPFGQLVAYVYWVTEVGHCVLSDDGTISPHSSIRYITEWRFAKESKGGGNG